MHREFKYATKKGKAVIKKNTNLISLSKQLALASVTGLALVYLCAPVWAADGALRNIRYDQASRHFMIDASGPVKATVNTLNIAGHKRIIIDLDNAEIGMDLPRDLQLLQDLSRQLPSLKNLTVNQYGGNGRPIVRVLLDIQGDPGSIRVIRNQGPNIELEVRDSAAYATPSTSNNRPTANNRRSDVPPSLSNLPRTEQPTSRTPVPNTSSSDTVPREWYTRGLQAQQDQQKQIETLQREVDRLNLGLAKATTGSAEADDLKRTLAEMNGKYESLLQDNQSLRSQLSTTSQNQNSSKTELDRLRSEVEQVRTENRNLQSHLSQAAAAPKGPSADDMKRTLAEMNRQYDKLQQENRTLKSQVAARKPTSTVSDADLSNLRKQLTTAQQSLNDSIQTINQQNKEIAFLKNQVADVKSGMGASAQEQISRLEEAQEEKDGVIRELQKQLAAAKSSTKTASGDNPNNRVYSSELQKKDSQIAALQKELAELKSGSSPKESSTSLKEALDRLTRENKQLQGEISSFRSGGQSSRPAGNSEAERNYQEAKAAQSAKDIKKAIDKFKAAQLLEPNHSSYAIDYSIALAEDHQYAEAIDAMRRYLQRNPGDREAYNQLGKLYLLNDDATSASQAFSRALSISTLNNYATALKKVDRMADAEAIFKLALTLNPKDSEVLFNLGNLYNTQNKLDLARNKYLEAIQYRPDFAEAHYNLGLIFSKMGDNTKAVSHLEKYLQLSPHARNAETIRAYVQKLKA